MANYSVSGGDLTSVASAIRTKGGTSAALSFPAGFVTAISNIPTGGSATLITKNITANGTYNASSDNADGYSSVTVNVSGGGGGLVYETGTYTLASDKTNPTISFANAHTGRPFFVMMCDTSANAPSQNSIYYWTISNWYDVFGNTAIINDYSHYARVQYAYKTSSSVSVGGRNVTSISDFGTLITASSFIPFATVSYSWRTGRTYKWIAVWAPTT